MTKYDQAIHTIEAIRAETDQCLLFNSFGKDSLVCLDLIAPRFRRVVNVFMYFVPGLEHIARFQRQCLARYPSTELIQIPHWNLTYLHRGGLYCEPDAGQRLFKLRNVVQAATEQTGIPHVFLGMKKADGMNRRLMLDDYRKTNGDYINNHWAYPLATWTQKEVLAYMRHNRLPAPVRYSKNASSGVGFNLDCFLWMEQNAPDDLQRMYDAYPWSRRILFEYHYNNPQLTPQN